MKKFDSIEEKVIYEKLTSQLNEQATDIRVRGNVQQFGNLSDGSLNSEKISAYVSEIGNNIDTLEQTRANTSYRLILSNRRVLGSLIVFIKRIIRRCLGWYIEPVCTQQTGFNNAVTPAVGRLTEIQCELLSAFNTLNNEYNHIRDNSNNMKEKVVTLEDNTNHIQGKVVALEDCTNNIQTIMSRDYQLLQSLELNARQIENRISELERLQSIANTNLNETNAKLHQLNDLELGIFKDDKNNFFNKRTTAQAGEDSIVAYIIFVLGLKWEDCVYLDLGANHAKDLSNTYYFYQKGARGILVEANPALIPELKFYRHGDIILNNCISTVTGNMIDFYILNGDGLSTPDLNSALDFIEKNPRLEIIETVSVSTITVNDIITNYIGKAPLILNIDLEGKDIEILNSIDWEQYRPLIVITEMIEYKPTLVIGIKNQETIHFMESKGYVEYAFTGINSIFIDETQVNELISAKLES